MRNYRIAFWLIVAAIVAWTIICIKIVWSGSGNINCCSSVECSKERHHEKEK